MSLLTMLAPIRPKPIIASCMHHSPSMPYSRPQPLECRRDAVAISEDRRPGHQHIGARFHGPRRSLGVDPAIHLEAAARLDAIDHRTGPPDLGKRPGKEMLVPE